MKKGREPLGKKELRGVRRGRSVGTLIFDGDIVDG